MQKTLTSSDFLILGYSNAKVVEDKSAWSIFEAEATAGLRKISDTFLYIKSAASQGDERQAVNRVSDIDGVNIIVPKSRQQRLKSIRQQLKSNAQAYIYEDLIWQKLESTFHEYLENLRTGIPRPDPFVKPHEISDPSEDVLQTVRAILAEDSEAPRQLLALLAPAGVGKTTLSRVLTAKLADTAKSNRLIPVYVEASHWRQAQLNLERTDDLWDIVFNSLIKFSPEIRLTRTLYDHLLNSGDIAFIFDGFDELCAERYSPFSPREVAKHLAEMAADSGARIMLTTRTAFWEAEVGTELPNVRLKTLAPFTKQQAHHYLEKRFSKQKKTFKRAQSLLAKVRSENQPVTPGGGKQQITYHPYVVELIATAAESNADSGVAFGAHTLGGTENVMLDILSSMCDREQLRQELRTSAAGQMEALQELSMEQLSTGEVGFPVDMIEAAGINADDLSKLNSHPLFKLTAGPMADEQETYEFRYEFIPYLFGAKAVIERIAAFGEGAEQRVDEQLLKLLSRFREGNSQLFDHIETNWPSGLPVDAVGKLYRRIPNERKDVSRCLVHICRSAASKLAGTRIERTRIILGTLGGQKKEDQHIVNDLSLQGTLDRLDLRAVTFRNCTFYEVVFQSCIADINTTFEKCRFFGSFQVIGQDRKTWGSIKLVDTREMNSMARVSMEELQQGASGTGPEFIVDLLELALRKFWRHGHLRRHVLKDDWSKGVLGEVRRANDVLEVLLEVKLVKEIPAAGGREASYEFNIEALGDLQRFMDNRQRTGKVLQAYKALENSQ